MAVIRESTTSKELVSLSVEKSRADMISRFERSARLEKGRGLVAEAEMDALLIEPGNNLRFFSEISLRASKRLIPMRVKPTDGPIFISLCFEEGRFKDDPRVSYEQNLRQVGEKASEVVAQKFPEDGRAVSIDPETSCESAVCIARATSYARLLVAEGSFAGQGLAMRISAFDTVSMDALCGTAECADHGALERGGFAPGYPVPGLPHRTRRGNDVSLNDAVVSMRTVGHMYPELRLMPAWNMAG